MPQMIQEFDNSIIPPSYFEPEAREGFYVSGMMKRYWAAQLRVLAEIAKVCEKHGIRWFADWGTLLGTVRHKGYIPWDDDIDICMLREDFEHFSRIAAEELPDGYCVRSKYTEKSYDMILTRVLNSKAIMFSEEHLRTFFNCPYSMGVDIFPLDGVYEDDEREDQRRDRIKAIDDVMEMLADGHAQSQECRNKIMRIEQENHVKLRQGEDMVYDLLALVDRIYTECLIEETDSVAQMSYWTRRRCYRYPKACFADVTYLPFEFVMIPVPSGYHEVLKIEYNEYMHAVRSGGYHDYPCYRIQEKIFRDQAGQNLYRYTFDHAEYKEISAQNRLTMKERCDASMDLLAKVHSAMERVSGVAESEVLLPLLEKCQSLAIGIGTELEKRLGEDAEAVQLLEQYCEAIYQSAQDWQGSAGLQGLLEKIRNEAHTALDNRKEIVFMPCHANSWPVMQKLWKEAVADPKAEVYVIAVPYLDRNQDGTLGEARDERAFYPADVELTDIEAFDLEAHHPDVIVIDQPYDGWNLAGSVPDSFFSGNLRQYTDKLVYLPCLELEDPVSESDRANTAIAWYVEQPALIFADEIILYSEAMRDLYIKILTELAGEDSAAYWASKITVR